MKKKIYIFLSLIQLILFLIGSILTYLSDKKMGVMRSLTYKNLIWNNQRLDVYLVAVLTASLILWILLYILNKKFYILFYFIINIILLSFVIFFSTESIFSYFVIGITLTFLLFLEAVKRFLK